MFSYSRLYPNSSLFPRRMSWYYSNTQSFFLTILVPTGPPTNGPISAPTNEPTGAPTGVPTNEPTSDSDTQQGGTNVGAVVGVAIGAFAGLLILGVVAVHFLFPKPEGPTVY